ncbi:class Ib ribonucleoside-diphosphate reductase assembly flavoprotein NrdI [Parapedobacter sp. 10938]|uniref:class Ib ribonucleoside-diphosphate reductase assembly flavoprotein NrdI n=1 Tax=Parapedobacter flavus TaxID=3110225 RepID=UPI002DBD03BF|nr:class Ib ribonucleoside-diphosphate reductase assembly flavoprotein NrdI [Parapedobacter sp. 10938]MEC3881805.1 class Ib ribonucleoside-diphosphate reductase assembly flavoprotein NrdI [Parapedobacter sp. 10938]
MLIIFASRTGNVKRFVNKAVEQSVFKLRATELPDTVPFDRAHLVTYTGPGGEIPPIVDNFLMENHRKIISVSGSGNRNWGRNFAAAVDKISLQYGIPINTKFEISGSNDELKSFIDYINNPQTMETNLRIIKFQTESCVTCSTVAKALDSHGIPYRDINPFDHPDMAAKYRVRSVPTVVALDGEQEVLRMVGYKQEVIEQLHTLVSGK